MRRGYWGIGIENNRIGQNIGTLWRSAAILGASFIFTVNRRYKDQCTDTVGATRHIPLFHFSTMEDLKKHLPKGAPLIGLELHAIAVPIDTFVHPESATYLLGSEDAGLTNQAIEACHMLVQLPGEHSMNVSVAGSIIMFHRLLTMKEGKTFRWPQQVLT